MLCLSVKSQVAMSVAFPQNTLGALVVEIHWPTLQSKLFTKRGRVREIYQSFILFYFWLVSYSCPTKQLQVMRKQSPFGLLWGLPQDKVINTGSLYNYKAMYPILIVFTFIFSKWVLAQHSNPSGEHQPDIK